MTASEAIALLSTRIPLTSYQKLVDSIDKMAFVSAAVRFVARQSSQINSNYYLKRFSFGPLPNTQSHVDLPNDFKFAKRFAIYGSAPYYNQAEEIDVSQLSLLNQPGNTIHQPTKESPIFWVEGNTLDFSLQTIYFLPAADNAGDASGLLIYIRKQASVSTESDILDVHPDFEDVLVDYCEALALRKLGAINEANALEQTIIQNIQNLSQIRVQKEVAETEQEESRKELFHPTFGRSERQ